MKVLIIIPAYNEELNIEATVKDVKNNTNYDYVIVNDGSKDKTKEICQKNNFNLISLPINYGLTSAIQVGMKYAKENNYDIAIQFDGDGQHQAKELKKLVKGVTEGADIVIGSRFVTEHKPRTMRMLGAIEELVSNPGLSPEPDTIVYMLKKKKLIKEVQVEMQERKFGESYLKPLKAMKYMINMFCSIVFIRSFTKKA